MKVLLIAPSGGIAEALTALGLDNSSSEQGISVFATSTDAPGLTTQIDLGQRALPAKNNLSQKLDHSVIGRTLKRLSPFDGGRTFARAAGRSRRYRASVQSADLIVALERDAILTAWIAIHRWSPPHAQAVYGLAPGRALLTSMRIASHSERAG